MNTRIVVLAAGEGKRMKSGRSKMLTPLKERPIITHLLASIASSGIDQKPVLVVGYGADEVKAALGPDYEYVLQEAQLGTGHAVQCTESTLRENADTVIVLYGDQPLIHAETIAKLHTLHKEKKSVLTMVTTKVGDFEDWRLPFFDFGRIVRDGNGKIASIVEKKDATPEELAIREVNPSFFCFDAEWLWKNLRKVDRKNVQGEYYLTDLVRIAIDEGRDIASMDIDPLESIGVNTPEHLQLVSMLTSA